MTKEIFFLERFNPDCVQSFIHCFYMVYIFLKEYLLCLLDFVACKFSIYANISDMKNVCNKNIEKAFMCSVTQLVSLMLIHWIVIIRWIALSNFWTTGASSFRTFMSGGRGKGGVLVISETNILQMHLGLQKLLHWIALSSFTKPLLYLLYLLYLYYTATSFKWPQQAFCSVLSQ